MPGWLQAILVAAGVLVLTWLVLRYVARSVPGEALFEAWPGNPDLLRRLLGVSPPPR